MIRNLVKDYLCAYDQGGCLAEFLDPLGGLVGVVLGLPAAEYFL